MDFSTTTLFTIDLHLKLDVSAIGQLFCSAIKRQLSAASVASFLALKNNALFVTRAANAN
jgi:hypothetical protein